MNRLSPHFAAMLLAGCAVGPDYKVADVSALTPAAFSDAGNGESPADWWRTLGDPALDALVADALGANRDLRAAEANVRAARASLGLSRYDLAPTVRTVGEYRRGRTSADGLGATIPGLPSGQPFPDTNLFDAGVTASWEIDFWGRVRRGVEASRATYESADADRRIAEVSVTADVAAAYVALRGAERQLGVARRNADKQQETRDLTESLEQAGRASSLDASRARAQHETTLATLAPFEAEIAAQRRRLAVLTGRAPDALPGALNGLLAGDSAFPQIPKGAPAGDPATLLRQRPDIRKAERDLAAATARIGVAAGDLFPRVRFVGAIGASASSLATYGSGASIDYGFGPTIEWAAFDLGRVRARIRQSEAEADGALARYEQTTLRALEEAGNAFTSLARERERNARLARAVLESADAAALAASRYRAGIDGFLNVLDAERRLLDAGTAAAASDTRTLQLLIGAYRAMGGGWQATGAVREASR
ncbi:MAG: efflux transporter outer membrane subunit [Parvularculaceae bacterium]